VHEHIHYCSKNVDPGVLRCVEHLVYSGIIEHSLKLLSDELPSKVHTAGAVTVLGPQEALAMVIDPHEQVDHIANLDPAGALSQADPAFSSRNGLDQTGLREPLENLGQEVGGNLHFPRDRARQD